MNLSLLADAAANTDSSILLLAIFVLAVFIGVEVITKIPPTLHTPLMSGSNAVSGITLVGAVMAAQTETLMAANYGHDMWQRLWDEELGFPWLEENRDKWDRVGRDRDHRHYPQAVDVTVHVEPEPESSSLTSEMARQLKVLAYGLGAEAHDIWIYQILLI